MPIAAASIPNIMESDLCNLKVLGRNFGVFAAAAPESKARKSL